ncbi:MAG TPA: hypothetical protein DDW49_00500 [Deltaproteobacteria bacterium]|nr:hypothetical protein [Deltaproteobacteria bacterium]
MKILPRHFPLSTKAASRLYWELKKRGAFCEGNYHAWPFKNFCDEELFSMALLQARYDPRLMAILVHYFRHIPVTLHPLIFKESLRKHEGLSTAAVLGEYVLDSKAPETNKELFGYLATGIKPEPLQLFYKGLYPISGSKMEEAITQPLWAFKKWGFLAADPPLLKEEEKTKRTYLYDKITRLELLKKMLQEKKETRLQNYLHLVGHGISRQQALKDLEKVPWIKKTGKNKGTIYRWKAPS